LTYYRQVLAIEEGMAGQMGVHHAVIDHAAFANGWSG